MTASDSLNIPGDSVVTDWSVSEIPIVKSLQDHLEMASDWGSGSVTLIAQEQTDSLWKFLVLIAFLSLFAYLRIIYHSKFRQLYESFLNARYMKQIVREELALSHPFSLMLMVQYALLSGALLYVMHELYWFPAFGLESWVLFLAFSGVILVALLLKTLLTVIIQWLIGSDNGQTENRYNMVMFNEVNAVFLIPMVIIAFFGPESMIPAVLLIALIIIILVYLYRIFRGIITGISYGSPAFYIFLYLCTLEIIPFIVLMRVLIREIG